MEPLRTKKSNGWNGRCAPLKTLTWKSTTQKAAAARRPSIPANRLMGLADGTIAPPAAGTDAAAAAVNVGVCTAIARVYVAAAIPPMGEAPSD